MSRETTAREAMIAEMVGDITELLDRMETLTPAMDASRKKLADTAAGMTARVETLKTHLVETATQAERTTLDSISRRTQQMVFESYCSQTRAMEDSARAIVDKEIRPPLRELADKLQVLIERTRRPQWVTWATHAATGAASAALTLTMATAIYFSLK